jgi:uroporphyrinogen decarboxylase
LIDKITSTVIAYLRMKIQAGVQIVQIFDSWAGLLTPALFQRVCASGNPENHGSD